MKKCIFTFSLALLAVLAPMAVNASENISVTIGGQAVVFPDQPPAIVDGRTMVPVAGVFQALGFNVQWDGDTRQATLTRPGETVVITIGSNMFTTNGIYHNLDVPAQIIGGRTMLPIAAVLRSVGYDVDWDGVTSTVAVSREVPAAVVEAVPPPVAASPEPEPVPTANNVFPFAFSSEDIFGNPVTEASLGDREFYFVYLWATWCPACVIAMPGMAELMEEFGDRVGFLGLLIDFDTALDTAVRIVNDSGAAFIHVNQRHPDFQELHSLVSTGFVPSGALFSSDGRIGEPLRGGVSGFRNAIEAALN